MCVCHLEIQEALEICTTFRIEKWNGTMDSSQNFTFLKILLRTSKDSLGKQRETFEILKSVDSNSKHPHNKE